MGYQVYSATHDGQGNPLSVVDRQFISFNYGGKDIEDFGFLVTFSNDRLEKDAYGSFTDTTTTLTGVDGQIFWGTSFNGSTLSFTLSTDGVTSKQLEEFKRFFKPGEIKPLILSEYNYRKINARISTPPQISLLPFESFQEQMIGGIKKSIRTSLYKGDIQLTFIFDEPFWESTKGCLDYEDEGETYDKAIYEDGLPSREMFENVSCFLGNDKYWDGSDLIEQAGITITKNVPSYLYYSGTFSARPIIQFSILPTFTNNLLTIPKNEYTSQDLSYSSITIGNKVFKYTQNSGLLSINKAAKIIDGYQVGDSIFDLIDEMRENITHYYGRAWALAILNGFKDDRTYTDIAGTLKGSFITQFKLLMKYFIYSCTQSPVYYSINNKTGEIIATYKCRTASSFITTEGQASSMSFVDLEENSGDINRGDYLILEEMNAPNSNGKISASECTVILSDETLGNFKISYNYTYL